MMREINNERVCMKYELTDGAVLTDERSEASYGVPVLEIAGKVYGAKDHLPAPWRVAGYDENGKHTGRGDDYCSIAGVVVKAHAGSILSNFPIQTFEFIRSFYGESQPIQAVEPCDLNEAARIVGVDIA